VAGGVAEDAGRGVWVGVAVAGWLPV